MNIFANKNVKGQKYEDLIRYIYEQKSNLNGKPIDVKRNINLIGKSGVSHQIDVFYEFEMNGIKHRVVIECKDHDRPISKGQVQEFKAKLDDIGNCTGVVVSSNGFQSGAEGFAKHYDIELIGGNDFSLLCKIIAEKIAVFLPSEHVIGEPFWTIMEESKGSVTGTYKCLAKKVIGLFFSKKVAEKVSKKTGGVVRGVTQKHLRMMLEFAKLDSVDFCIIIFDDIQGLQVTQDLIRDYFLVD